jgi:drug/metabolite transporter (DMT)-like permease
VRYLEQHPMIMIIFGIMGISLSAIFVRYSDAPSAVTASYRLLWTVFLMSPMVWGAKKRRRELRGINRKALVLCGCSGIFLALHFFTWFESLKYTTVASSTTIVCTEAIWVALGYCLFLKGRLAAKEVAAIAVTLGGSLLVAYSDSGMGGGHLYGDVLALSAAGFVAGYTLIGQVVRTTLSTTAYTYIVYLFSAAALVVLTAVQGYSLAGYGGNTVMVGLLLAVFSTILGHSIFSWCLKFLSPAFVSASKLCEPVVAAVFAAMLFGERPAVLQVAGGAVIIGGVIFYSRQQ